MVRYIYVCVATAGKGARWHRDSRSLKLVPNRDMISADKLPLSNSSHSKTRYLNALSISSLLPSINYSPLAHCWYKYYEAHVLQHAFEYTHTMVSEYWYI